MAEVEKVARELLAAEYEADDMAHIAAMLRAGGDGHMPTQAALRAIQAAYVAGLEEAKGICEDAATARDIRRDEAVRADKRRTLRRNYGDQEAINALANVAVAIQRRIGEVKG